MGSKGTFRVNDWWQSKAALLMGLVYLFAAWFSIGFSRFIPLALLSLATIAGFASFGYLVNDLFDIKEDARAGKHNSLAGKPLILILLLFCISACFIFVPWIWLPHTTFSFALIAFQIILFLVYSIPPLRLKEKGLAGIFTDALYAHAVPALLAAYTFSLVSDVPFSNITLVLLFAWQMLSGIRNILLHQDEDLGFDLKAGIKSYVATLSKQQLYTAFKLLIIAETITSLLLLLVLASANLPFVIPVVTVLLFCIIAFSLFRKPGIAGLLNSEWRFFPNNVYEKWLPAAYLVVRSFADTSFLFIMVLHIAAFNFSFYTYSGTKAYQFIQPKVKLVLVYTRIFIAYMVNYAIYYSLRIFGVDLRKENTSALGYIKRKLGSK